MDDYELIETITADRHGAKTLSSHKSIGDFFLDDDPSKPVNVKSNNVDKKNYSPNIISAIKLLKWIHYKGNEMYFIFVDYRKIDGEIILLEDSGLVPFYHLSWSCLSIEAQGWGVTQMNKARCIDTTQTSQEFFAGMKVAYARYMSKEEAKLAEMRRLLEDF